MTLLLWLSPPVPIGSLGLLLSQWSKLFHPEPTHNCPESHFIIFSLGPSYVITHDGHYVLMKHCNFSIIHFHHTFPSSKSLKPGVRLNYTNNSFREAFITFLSEEDRCVPTVIHTVSVNFSVMFCFLWGEFMGAGEPFYCIWS